LSRGKSAAAATRGPLHTTRALGCLPRLPGPERLWRPAAAAHPRPDAPHRAVGRTAARARGRLPAGPGHLAGVRAPGRLGRRIPGMALPAREDGGAHHRHPARHRWLGGRGVPADHAASAGLPRSLGDPDRSVKTGADRGGRGRAEAGGGAVEPEALARHYSRFRVSERVLLTGHFHQAWPDCGFEGQQRPWLDAAELVDDMWERAFAQADLVRRGFARLLDDAPERIALAANTH